MISSIKLIDTHCHLDFPEFDVDRDLVIRRAKEQGIEYIINIGSSLKSSVGSLELAEKFDFIYAAVGIHPHEADRFSKNDLAGLRELVKKDKVIAIGEIGLDYYKNYSGAQNQEGLFSSLVSLGKEFNLPLVIHSRQAEDDTFRILKEAMPVRAVVHCFSGGENFLKNCLELGFFISFTCNITYKKAHSLREIIKITPLERIFLETDAPYLSPEGLRGMRNEPVNVKFVAGQIAQIKDSSVEEAAKVTTAGAKNFFHLP